MTRNHIASLLFSALAYAGLASAAGTGDAWLSKQMQITDGSPDGSPASIAERVESAAPLVASASNSALGMGIAGRAGHRGAQHESGRSLDYPFTRLQTSDGNN